jgi:hypothetical protein
VLQVGDSVTIALPGLVTGTLYIGQYRVVRLADDNQMYWYADSSLADCRRDSAEVAAMFTAWYLTANELDNLTRS